MAQSATWLWISMVVFVVGCTRSDDSPKRYHTAVEVPEYTPISDALMHERKEKYERLAVDAVAKRKEAEDIQSQVERLHVENLKEQAQLNEMSKDRQRLSSEVERLSRERDEFRATFRSEEASFAALRKDAETLLGKLADAQHKLPQAVEPPTKCIPPLTSNGTNAVIDHESKRTSTTGRAEVRERLRMDMRQRAEELGYKVIELEKSESAPVHIIRRSVAAHAYDTFYYPPEAPASQVYVRVWGDSCSRRMYFKIDSVAR